MHHNVHTLEQRLEIVARDVDSVVLQALHPPGRLARVETDDPVPGAVEPMQESLSEEAGDAGDGDGGGVHESP